MVEDNRADSDAAISIQKNGWRNDWDSNSSAVDEDIYLHINKMRWTAPTLMQHARTMMKMIKGTLQA